MKIERVALKGFLSHRDTDWSPNGARLVSLVGPNGAGKSTLASDALSFALFDQARGRTDDIVRLGETEASVLVEFTYGGERYRVERGRSTKSGGKSRLEFAVEDQSGRWQPLTRETIRDTQAAIAELLQLDADTFATAVLLAQGSANRFAEATAGERKRILGTVLGLDVYAAAEARARELARDVDARVSLQRTTAERLEDEVASGREGLEAELARAREELDGTEATLADGRGRLAKVDARIHELDVALAGADSLAEQITGLERDRALAADDWRRANNRLTSAQSAAGEAQKVLEDADDVAAAAAALPLAREQLAALQSEQAEESRIRREIGDLERAARDLEIPHLQAAASWRAQLDAAVAHVDELVAHAKAGASVCVTCGQAIDQEQALEQLAAARAAVKELGDGPQAPLQISRLRAQVVRHESRLGELKVDHAALIAAQQETSRLERLAARGESIEVARRTLERAIVDGAAADTERQAIADRGAAIAARIDGLRTELEASAPFREERSAAGGKRERILVEIDQLGSAQRQLERAIAAGEAHLAELEKKADHAAGLRTAIAGDETEAGRLRRLVQAFGVTGIPARIIEGVLPELAAYANELLGELRPGMVLELRAQRVKRDGKGTVEALDLVVRDAVGERPLALFSGGERMSVSLALAVALSRLVARRAGARIETLICDEPEGLDATARRAFGHAVRTIAHRGELLRVVLVSHHDDLAEFADETYSVSKGPNGSVVELVS